MKEVILNLTWFDIITLAVAIFSIFLNILQFLLQRRFYKPIYNILNGLYNDMMFKISRFNDKKAVVRKKIPEGEPTDNEFTEFCNEVIIDLRGFQEHISAALHSMQKREERWLGMDYGLPEELRHLRREPNKGG